MKALFPVFCRPMGYVVMVIAVFMPILMALLGKVSDNNLLFYRECSKLLMMMGCIMIIFALSKDENEETEKVRNRAVRNAIFLTVLYIFINMLYRVFTRDLMSVDSSTFLIFLIINVLCVEYELNRIKIQKMFRGK